MRCFMKSGIPLCSLGLLFVALTASTGFAEEEKKSRLFILSGQSNMVGINPDVSFTPTVKKAFPNDEVIVVKSAQGAQPIRRWYKSWKGPGKKVLEANAGDLYDVLMDKVKQATKGKTIDSIAFIWMQGEADAKRGPAGYEGSLRGLIKQVRDDFKRPDVVFVIGRLSDHKKGQEGWDSVRAAQEKVAGADHLAAWVNTDDLNGAANALHYTREGYEILGRRFAEKALELLMTKSK